MNPADKMAFIEFVLENQVLSPEEGRFLLEHADEWGTICITIDECFI